MISSSANLGMIHYKVWQVEMLCMGVSATTCSTAGLGTIFSTVVLGMIPMSGGLGMGTTSFAIETMGRSPRYRKPTAYSMRILVAITKGLLEVAKELRTLFIRAMIQAILRPT